MLSVGFIETYPDLSGDLDGSDSIEFVRDTLAAAQFCARMGWTFQGWDDQENGIAMIEIHTLEDNNANEIEFEISLSLMGSSNYLHV